MKKLLFAAMLSVVMSSCCCDEKPALDLFPVEDFTTELDGQSISLYTLTNAAGSALQVTNYGARVVSLWTADSEGNFADIVLGFNTIDKYINNTGERFLGATIGRYGNRIADGKFSLDGVDYQLSTYNNGQCLHGGDIGYDKVVWSVDSVSSDAIHFSYISKDMEEGFPGELKVKMIYSLTADNEFRIDYEAVTDKATPVNLTHHSFFNLKGEGCGTINDHIVTLAADHYTPVNASLIPLGINEPVEGTPFDFRQPTAIGERLDQENVQFDNCLGYDHNWVLNRTTDSELEFAVRVEEPTTGRCMEIWTTEPGLQFYGGNFFNGTTKSKRGDKSYDFRGSFAMETQHFPDSPNQPTFPSTILNPGEIYTHTCIYRFSAK